jgi:hypothetical protein
MGLGKAAPVSQCTNTRVERAAWQGWRRLGFGADELSLRCLTCRRAWAWEGCVDDLPINPPKPHESRYYHGHHCGPHESASLCSQSLGSIYCYARHAPWPIVFASCGAKPAKSTTTMPIMCTGRVADYYYRPRQVLPSLYFANDSDRGQRSERREACVLLLKALLKIRIWSASGLASPLKTAF